MYIIREIDKTSVRYMCYKITDKNNASRDTYIH